MSKNRLLISFLLTWFTVAFITACQSNATPTLADLPGPGIGVGISDDICPSIFIKAGQYISWTNQGKQDHIVRAKPGPIDGSLDSGILKPGDSFSIQLTAPDSFQYDCSEDGSLTGTITVEP